MRALKWIERNLELMFLLMFLVLISVLLMTTVVLRFIFNTSVVWFDEVARYAFVLSVFLGASYGIRHDVTFRMTGIIDHIPLKIRFALEMFIDAGVIAFFAYMTYHAKGVVEFMTNNGQLTAVIKFPMAWIYLAVCICFGIGTIRSIQKMYWDIKAGPQKFAVKQYEEEAAKALESEGVNE